MRPAARTVLRTSQGSSAYTKQIIRSKMSSVTEMLPARPFAKYVKSRNGDKGVTRMWRRMARLNSANASALDIRRIFFAQAWVPVEPGVAQNFQRCLRLGIALAEQAIVVFLWLWVRDACRRRTSGSTPQRGCENPSRTSGSTPQGSKEGNG